MQDKSRISGHIPVAGLVLVCVSASHAESTYLVGETRVKKRSP